MEFLSAEWFAALLAIVIIDLLLAGDNAVVIALAARDLPPQWKKRAVIYGTAGAIFVRVVLAFFVVWLLKIPGLGIAGGLILYFIAWRLLKPPDEKKSASAANSFFSAMVTIIIADTVMGLDNILAIAGAASGDVWLIVIGLALSIPIMMGGSMLILRCLEKMPWLVIGGSALLSVIAGRVIADDKTVRTWLEQVEESRAIASFWAWDLSLLVWLIILSTAFVVTMLALLHSRR